MLNQFHRVLDLMRTFVRLPKSIEKQMVLHGKLLSQNNRSKTAIGSFKDVEFSIFSQFGDDGIIQWLIHHLDLPNRTFIEFGVEDYYESNTRFLLMNDNWVGIIMDGSESNIRHVTRMDYFWKYNLTAKSVFIDRKNINSILAECNVDPNVGLLHIDLDGVDYWIWEAINVISPIILILEYNSLFGKDRAITVPYDTDFNRTKAHYSNLYWGASLMAIHHISSSKGYSFIGSNSAGNNAYFIRSDKLNPAISEISVQEGYVESQYRESRDQNGKLTYLTGTNRLDILRGLPVYNVLTNQLEVL